MTTNSVISPITHSSNVILIRTFSSNEIISLYKKKANINVDHIFKGVQTINLYECTESKYRFFTPTSIIGDATFYQELAKFPWYYIEDRWEFSETIKHIKNEGNVLEIGAGEGNFIAKGMRERPNAKWHGVDMSTSNETIFESIDELIQAAPIKFDAICLFQTLEHISEPLKYLKQMCDLLKPGGKLIISVPNNDSFIRHAQHDFLNMPPHHMGLWTSDSLTNLKRFLPISLNRILQSPLAREHELWFLKIQLNKALGGTLGKIASKVLSGVKAQYLLRPFKNNIIGHTVLVIFNKK